MNISPPFWQHFQKGGRKMENKTPYFDSNVSTEMNIYFDTLPKNVQETIIQSHGNVGSLEELKSIAQNLMAK